MVNIYESMNNENGDRVTGRTMLFIIETDDSGSIIKRNTGIAFAPLTNGTMFIVDDWLIPQLDKVQFKDGILSVKEGAEIIPPVKTDLELEEEDLLRRIAEIQAQKKANTEEQAEQPAE